MMDAQTLLSDAQALTATAVSTNSYDKGAAGNDIAAGEPLGIELTVDVAADITSGNETYVFSPCDDDNAALSSAAALYACTLAAALLTAGAQFVLPIPKGLSTQRYLGLAYTLGGTTPTITVTASIKPLSLCEGRAVYADNVTIS